jgi:exonuclease SbcC
MALLLDKFFKPKWRHDKAGVRIQAISDLSWEVPEQQAILKNCILTDPDDAVREAAIQRVAGVAALLELLTLAGASGKTFINHRLEAIAAHSPQELEDFLKLPAKGMDTALLFKLGGWLHQQGRLTLLIDKLRAEDSDLTLRMAIDHPSSKVRLAAADSIGSPDELEALTKLSKGKDKSVYQSARTRLQAIRDADRQKVKERDTLQALCEALEQHAITESTQHYLEKLRTLRSNLESYLGGQNRNLLERAEVAYLRCKSREDAIVAARQQEAERIARQQENSTERQSTLAILHEVIAQLRTTAMEDLASLSTLNGLTATQENRWMEATRDHKVEKSEQKDYQLSMGQLRHYQSALQKYVTGAHELAAMLTDDKELSHLPASGLSQLKRMVDDIDWPEGFAPPSRLAEAHHRIGYIRQLRQQGQEDEKRLQQTARNLLDKLDTAVIDGAVKEARPLLKELTAILDRLPPSAAAGLYQHLRLEQKRLDELRDWAGFAIRPKQQDLVHRMEQLAGMHLEPHLKAEKIHDLQREWKSLGGTSDHSLWHRFKTAADLAYEPCKSYFEEEHVLKETNLLKRSEIVAQLTEYLNAVDWNNTDWKGADLINRQARQEWKRYFPVDFKKGKSLQEQFNQRLARLEEKLQEERSRNAAKKRIIVAEAAALADLEDLKSAIQQAKALQKSWESIGITEHKEDRQLWLAFRAACDRLFEKMQEEKVARENVVEGEAHRAAEIIAAVSSLAEDPQTGTESILHNYITVFRGLEDLGKRKVELQAAFDRQVKRCQQQLRLNRQADRAVYWVDLVTTALAARFNTAVAPSSFQPTATHATWLSMMQDGPGGQKVAMNSTRQSPEALVISLEILAGLDSPPAFSQQRMALQVARLTAGLQHHTQEIPLVRMESLLLEWASHPNLDASHATADLDRVRQSIRAIIVASSD